MRRVLAVAFASFFLLPLSVHAQEWTAEQLEVWKAVSDSWEAETQDDTTWFDRFVHPSFKGWWADLPVPRDFETAKAWNRYSMPNSKALQYSLHPLAIVVHGNTAVAYYYVSYAGEDLNGKRETTHQREVDTFVRDDGKWMILAWMGADVPEGGG